MTPTADLSILCAAVLLAAFCCWVFRARFE
jgi:hypothetical protein